MSFLDRLPKIPFLSSSKKEQVEYYFGLNIQHDKVVGSVWGIEGNRVRIVNSASAPYTSLEDLTQAANYALDEALADFSPEPSKVLFGVPDDWLLDEDLKPEYLKLLKQMVRELDVIPLAYVSTTHAVCHLLAKLSGVPLTAVLVNIADPLQVSVVKGGKVTGNKSIKRSANLPEDIEKALLTLNDIEVLPSKILIYGGEDIHKYKEELLSFAWMVQLPFLHLPKIDGLEKEVGIQAVSFAGASEINPDVHVSQADLEVKGPVKHQGISRPLEDSKHDNLVKGRKRVEDLGFVAGDIEELEAKQSLSSIRSSKLDARKETLGEETAVSHRKEVEVYHEQHPKHHEEHHPAHHPHRQLTLKDRLLAPISVLTSVHIPGVPTSFGGYPVRTLLIPLVLIALLVGGLLFFQKAHLTIFVDLKTLEKEATITADPTVTAVDETNRKIPGKEVSTDVSGSGKGQVSGKKQVGDPAKGTVVIYNKTSAPKSFSSGTVLQGPNNLTFKLDTSVNVASQSAVEGGISFGKGTANAIAEQIGPDGNLPAGRELSIKGLDSSQYSAKVDTAFSGGVSKDVTVVTADDQKKLLAQVSSELRAKAKEQIQGKLTGDQKVLEDGLTEKITKQTFSKNVGDQASELSLNLAANYKGTSYSDNDLKMIVSKLVQVNVPEGYDLDLSKTETQADVSKIEKDGRLIFAAKFKAKLMPKLDHEALKKDLAGKTPAEASERLRQIENVIGSDIKLSPPMPGPLQRLPFFARNITLEVTAK